MGKTSNEINCLARLEELSLGVQDSIMEFLMQEGLLTREERKAIISSSDIPKALHNYLKVFSTTGKLQLLEFEWIMLPVERLKVTVITDRNSKEFSYNF